MASSFVLDTHTIIWYLEGNRRLGSRARSLIAASTSRLILPIIVLAEADVIIDQRRTKIPSTAHLLDSLQADLRIEIYPLTLEVFVRSLSPIAARVPELHDRLIVATALHLQDSGEDIAIITRDQTITALASLPIVW